VFFLPKAIYVVASARTNPGFEISVEPAYELDRSSSSAHLGDSIVSALNSFQMDVPPPDPRSMNRSPILKTLKAKSWRQFEAAALHVIVILDGEKIEVTPTARDTARGGYTPRPDLTCECTFEAQRIAETVLGVLEHCC